MLEPRHADELFALEERNRDRLRRWLPWVDGTKSAEDVRTFIRQSLLRRIVSREEREAIAAGNIIEDYPNDKYGPSCLVLGFTQAGRPLHSAPTHPALW